MEPPLPGWTTGGDIPSLTCDHSIPADSIILYPEDKRMIGYCGGCGTRVEFPVDPYQVGARNILTAVVGQLAQGEQPDLEVITEIIDNVGRVEETTRELRELLDLIYQMYEEQLNGDLGADLRRKALVAEHRAQMASHDQSEACEALEGMGLPSGEAGEDPEA